MKISFIIPAYNEEKYISECLKAMIKEKNNCQEETEIIVINNASTDKTKEIAFSFLDVKVIDELDKGLTKARQRGLIEAKGELLAYLDADTRMPEGWVQKALEQFSKNKNLASLSGPYYYYDLSLWTRTWARLYWNSIAFPIYYLVGYMLLGGNFIVKKEAILKIGGFDTNIKFYGEDTDIARRLSKFGKVKFMKSFWIWTSGRRIIKEGIMRTGLVYGMNYLWQVFAKKPFSEDYKDVR